MSVQQDAQIVGEGVCFIETSNQLTTLDEDVCGVDEHIASVVNFQSAVDEELVHPR